MTQQCPNELGLPFCLWTREAVGQLLAERFELSVSVWTVGRYLKQWGLTPQKPLRRAYEQDPQAVQQGIKEEYPALSLKQSKTKQSFIGAMRWGYVRNIKPGALIASEVKPPLLRLQDNASAAT